MRGYIGVTDPGWYERLAWDPGPKDANFWRPSPRAPVRLEPGTPFLFKLKAPHHAIAGFGFFASFTVLPDWLAWDTFQAANGVESLHALRARLGRIRTAARIAADPGGRIGCCLVAEARFFPPHEWIAAPRDWKITTQAGAGYDLAVGEGARMWAECRARANLGAVKPESATQIADAPPPDARYGAPALRAPRLGQGIFRVQVLDAYGRACAVTQEHSLPVLEAAHIRPYAEGGAHEIANGLSLRTDIHRLFDRGYVTVDSDHRFVVGRRLKDDYENGRSYYSLHGTALQLPATSVARPSPAALAWHHEHVFVG